MTSSIFLIGADNALLELTRTPYDSEDLLQRLIAEHPTLLGSAMGADGGLLLVEREYAVPDSAGGSGRWSIDHLFLDREGVPVLVEVKRATDTRARREVVAQMLDYAANGVAFWPVETIVEGYRRGAMLAGADPDQRLAEFLGEGESDAFWKAVEANLGSGRIRMVFLADEIAKELRRIVEFLNEQMRPAEVLAVEVVQYLNPSGVRTLVPSLVGATERAQAAKAIGPVRKPIDEPEWLASLAEMKGDSARKGAERVLELMREADLTMEVASAQDSISGSARLTGGRFIKPFYVRRSTGRFEISLSSLKNVPAFATDEARLALLNEVKARFPRARITAVKATGWPSLPLDLLLEEENWVKFRAMLEGILENIFNSASGGNDASLV